MPVNYQAIFEEYGVESIPEPEDTTLAFTHEIYGCLFDPDSPFDLERSSIDDFPDMLEHMLYCSLALKSGKSVHDGVSHLIKTWYRWLRYDSPKFECIQRTASSLGTDVSIFTISRDNLVCSFVFNIADEAADKAVQDYMDFYSLVDDPDALMKGRKHPESN